MPHFPQVGRTLGLTSLTIGAAAGLLGMGALAALRLSLPRTDGTQHLPGFADRVEILRDRWGVPHIYARSNSDLFAALGYVHAQDRLWQMELNRHTGHGRLSELFGPMALETDRFIRVLGFSRQARRDLETLSDETRAIIAAYVQGINTFLAANSTRLPVEFMLLRHQPQPWQAEDILVWSKIIAYGLSFNWATELLNAHILAALGEEQARRLLLHYPDDQPATLPRDAFARNGIGEQLLDVVARIGRNMNGQHFGEGSNAWVINGQRSSSGKPLLANDPHLSITLPSIWYEAHLEGGDFRVTGVTFPGAPGVLIGHNERIAWGITNSMLDVQDLYIERFDPQDPLRYAWRGEWEQAQVFHEEIHIKGQQEPFREEVRVTRHGPVISAVAAPPESPLRPHSAPQQPDQPDQPADERPAAPCAEHEEIALRWSVFDFSRTVQSLIALNRAHNWEEFRAAVAQWDAPPQNFVYADVDGHYGYALGGLVPIRARGDGRFPMPGWDGLHEWEGYIPADELPAAYDPSEGLAVSANNRITSERDAHHQHLHGEWMNGYRAMRIRELLDATPQHTVQSFASIQLDQQSLPGMELAHLVADLPLTDELEIQARDTLAAWDGDVNPDSVAASIYATLRYHLERQAYAQMGALRTGVVGHGIFQIAPGEEALSRRSLPGILARIKADWYISDAPAWPGADRSWKAILQESMRLAVNDLRQHFGADMQQWHYGRLHTLTLRHTLGRTSMLAPIFNRGSWPIGGDIDTICKGSAPHIVGREPVPILPCYRQICDTSDWDASICVLISGQSGHPASRHYTDMTALWLRGKYHPMLWSRSLVEQHTASTLIIEPEQQ